MNLMEVDDLELPEEIRAEMEKDHRVLREFPGISVMWWMLAGFGCYGLSLIAPDIKGMPGLATLIELRDMWALLLYEYDDAILGQGLIGLLCTLINSLPLFLISLLWYRRLLVKLLLSLMLTGVLVLGTPAYLYMLVTEGPELLVMAPTYWGAAFLCFTVACWVSLGALVREEKKQSDRFIA